MRQLHLGSSNIELRTEIVACGFELHRHSAKVDVTAIISTCNRFWQEGKPTSTLSRSGSTISQEEFAKMEAAGITGAQVLEFLKEL